MDQIQVIDNNVAKLNITIAGENGDLPDPVDFDAGDATIKAWATEAIRGGSVPGIAAREADFTDFVVDRIAAKDGLPPRLMLRPKTEYGQ